MINKFRGPFFFLSNFYECPVTYRGVTYKTAEHAYHAAKATNQKGHDLIKNAVNAKEAKRLGRKIECRTDWTSKRDTVMLGIIRCKFKDLKLRKLLLQTKDEEIFEGNDWNDLYWGVDVLTGVGENKLGKILMRVRKELQSV